MFQAIGDGQPRVALALRAVHRLQEKVPKVEILELLRTMVESYGQTTVMVTHDPQAAAIAHRILFLSDGRIVRDMGPSQPGDVIAAMEELSRR